MKQSESNLVVAEDNFRNMCCQRGQRRERAICPERAPYSGNGPYDSQKQRREEETRKYLTQGFVL